MKTIMILGGTPFQLPVIKKALEMGLRVVVADWNPEAIGFTEEGVIPEVMSIIDDEAVLAAAKKHKIDGILTICTDTPVRTIAKVVSELNLPGITEEAAFRCTDKAAMRTRWKECGIPIPKFYNVTTKDEYLEAVSHFPEKCVVKAVDNSGSRGIQLIYDVTDQAKVEEAFDYCKQFSRSGELVVEEFMEGPEVCVETLNQHGVCYPIQITDQLAKEPPYFTDCGYNQPTLLPDEIASEIRKITAAANIALGNNDGSSCTELIITKDGPKVVELGPRLGADGVTTVMVPLSTGISMVENVIKIALGEEIDINPKYTKGSCIRYFMKPVIGKIKEFRGLEEAAAVEGITDVTMLKQPGDMAVELRGSPDRIGFVVAQMDTPEEAIKQCEKALDLIEVVVE